MKFSVRSLGAVLVGVASLGAAVSAPAATPATLLGPDLQPRAVNIQGLSDGVLSYFDTDRVYKTEPVDQLVQIRDIGGPAAQAAPAATQPAGPAAYIDLIDGQRLMGKFAGAAEDGQKFQWQNAVSGAVTINLDNLRAMTLGSVPAAPGPKAQPAAPADNTSDRVDLANGEVIRGFVAGLGADGIEIKTADTGQTVKLPLERVAALRLGNNARLPQAGQHLVWLDDGSRVLTSSLAINDEELRFQPVLGPAGGAARLKMVRRIDLSSPAGVLRPLAAVPWTLSAGGDVFGVAMPPRIDAQQWRLHAPLTLSFDLPTGSSRLALTARLDTEGDEAEVKRWADMDVLIRIDDKEVAKAHIDGGHPTATINIPAAGRRMAIELGAGANGPVMDRLILQDAVLLLRR